LKTSRLLILFIFILSCQRHIDRKYLAYTNITNTEKFNKLKITFQNHYKKGWQDTETLKLEGKDEALTLEKWNFLSKDKADKIISSNINSIHGIFTPITIPYFSFFKKKTTCNKSFFPTYRNSKKLNVPKNITLYSGKRKNYGVCNKKEIYYMSNFSMIYCSKHLYLLKHYIKLESYRNINQFIQLLSCRK